MIQWREPKLEQLKEKREGNKVAISQVKWMAADGSLQEKGVSEASAFLSGCTIK